jgi:hypothetical protein
MDVKCQVFIDGSHIPVVHTFSTAPRIGEWITLLETEVPDGLIIEQVEHIIIRPPSNLLI